MEKYTYVGPFTYQWNNPPAPFNPDYDERAKHWLTLAVYDAHVTGIYNLPLAERKDKISIFYDRRKKIGRINELELKKAQEYLYNL